MHARHLWLLFTIISTLVLGLFFISDAGARRFQMSGKWEMRNGSLAIPAQNGPVAALGGVTDTGAEPPTLMVPPGGFAGNFAAKVPGGGGSLVQLTTAIGVMGPIETVKHTAARVNGYRANARNAAGSVQIWKRASAPSKARSRAGACGRLPTTKREIKAVEIRAEVRQIKTMADGTVNEAKWTW